MDLTFFCSFAIKACFQTKTMHQKGFIAFLALGFLAHAAPVSGEESSEEIRNFPIKTIESLGQELYQRDGLAAAAFDLLFKTHPEAQEQSLGGWITQLGDETSQVHLLKRTENEIRQGYIAVFEKDREPRIESHLDEPVPDSIAQRFNARTAAIAALPGFYDRPYNFEVLDDPDGEGFIVYSLVATKDANEMVVGGHSRIMVSADLETIRVDALSKSLLIINKDDMNSGDEVVGAVVSHIVSETPVETHVFLSLLHQRPFFVVNSDGIVWEVENGKVAKTDIEVGQEDEKSPEGDSLGEKVE